MISIFIIVKERSTAQTYCPIGVLSVVCKVFEKLVNNWIVYYLEKYDFFLVSSMVQVCSINYKSSDSCILSNY